MFKLIFCLSQILCTPSRRASRVISSAFEHTITGVNMGGSPAPLPGARVLTTRVNIPSMGKSGSGTEPSGKVNVFAFSS